MTEKKTRSREGWTRVRFGDVVTNVNDQPKRASLPLATRYVAGEHVDENRLRIDRWGTLGDELVPPTFRRRFGPSDVLFHSRNLKKIAVPDFGGITGEKLFVLRSTSPHLLQDFLPYVLLSPAFTAYAESSWSGSVNKFLNWTPLASYEFDLPPVEEQRRITHVLEATRAVRESTSNAISSSRLARAALAKEAGEGRFGDCRIHRIDELVHRMQYGVSVRPEPAGGIPLLRMGNLVDGMVDATDIKYAATSDINPERDLLRHGDVLFNRTNSIDLVGKAAIFSLEGEWAFASYLVRLIPRTELMLPEYLVTLINCAPIRSRILATATKGVSQANINTKNLGAVEVPVPSIDHQRRLVKVFADCRDTEERLAARLNAIPDAVQL